jgi:WhiB family transcriptional regulator, redox-sensing transcriptional regulator
MPARIVATGGGTRILKGDDVRTLSPSAPTPAVPAPRAPDPHPDWRRQSRCLREGAPDDFFPVGQGEAAQRQAERAKQVCARCPVQEQCLAWALDHEVRHGVFGGLDEVERRRRLTT